MEFFSNRTSLSLSWSPYPIAERSDVRADSIQRLLDLKLLTRAADGQLSKTSQHLSFKSQGSEAAIRNYHRQMIQKAAANLDRTSEIDFKRRSITSTTMGVRKEYLDEAKKKIEQFKNEMAQFLTEGSSEEVYQLSVQFFPLTEEKN